MGRPRGAPADLAARLAAAGLQILGEKSIDAERDRLARGAPALGLRLYLIAGGAAVALAVGAVLLTAYIGARARALRARRAARRRRAAPGAAARAAARVRAPARPAVRRSGWPPAWPGAALMLPGIPLVTVGTAIGEITYEPGLGALPVAVAVTVVGCSSRSPSCCALVRRATPDRLREGGMTVVDSTGPAATAAELTTAEGRVRASAGRGRRAASA